MAIPKKIHLIWLGSERPQKFEFLSNIIKDINHDYEVLEWNDDNIDFELKNQKLFDAIKNMGAKSDILRFELLYEYGGIYMDYDFLQIKKFDPLLSCDFFAGSRIEGETWNSIVGASKGNEICKKFLDGLENVRPINRREISRVMNETGPYYLHKIIKGNKWNCNITRLTGDYFYPFPATERHAIRTLNDHTINYIKKHATDKTYCIHLHTTTWQ